MFSFNTLTPVGFDQTTKHSAFILKLGYTFSWRLVLCNPREEHLLPYMATQPTCKTNIYLLLSLTATTSAVLAVKFEKITIRLLEHKPGIFIQQQQLNTYILTSLNSKLAVRSCPAARTDSCRRRLEYSMWPWVSQESLLCDAVNTEWKNTTEKSCALRTYSNLQLLLKEQHTRCACFTLHHSAL